MIISCLLFANKSRFCCVCLCVLWHIIASKDELGVLFMFVRQCVLIKWTKQRAREVYQSLLYLQIIHTIFWASVLFTVNQLSFCNGNTPTLYHNLFYCADDLIDDQNFVSHQFFLLGIIFFFTQLTVFKTFQTQTTKK